jgi:RNA polymerase sigma-70 factor (family 1)
MRKLLPITDDSFKPSGLVVNTPYLKENPIEVVPEEKPLVDTEFFIRLAFKENHKALCSHAVRFVYSREIAEDLVSEIFCRFWKTRAFEAVTSSFRYYLFRSVRNEAYNYLRLEFKKMEQIDAAEMQESSRSQQPDTITQYEETLKQVEIIVETLPAQCRKIFLMSRFEGKKYQEIADELGISIKTVEVHISKALNTMRNGLKDHWIS